MKKIHLLALAGLISVSILSPACGPESWEDRAAKRFVPLTKDETRAIARAQPKETTAKPQKDRRILVFWRCEGWIHTSIPSGNLALQEMAKATNAFSVDLADDYSVFTPENLKQYDGIVFNNTTELKFPEMSQREAIMDFIMNGKGIIGIHAATDSFYQWPAGAAMIGGQFSGHPWTAEGTYAFKLDEPDHTLNAAFHGRGFWHNDEIYQYLPATYQGPKNLRILVSLDMSKESTASRLSDPQYAKHNANFEPGIREVPVTWIRKQGQGRLFSTNFGHNESTYTKPVIMKHILDGIQYALGDLEVDDTPTAKIKAPEPALAPEM